MDTFTLSNGVEMPALIQGLPLLMGLSRITKDEFIKIVEWTVERSICGFDTSHEYGKSEGYLQSAIRVLKRRGIPRDSLFIISKIGNGQQQTGNIADCVDLSLKTMGLEYLDCMLLHWPVPGKYIENWDKLTAVYKTGKVRSIGIANARERHLRKLSDQQGLIFPHVVQTEIHPFNTCMDLRTFCCTQKIHLQSCSSLCCMIEKVRKNPILKQIAHEHQKSIPQIMIRWLLQNSISPVFRAFQSAHLDELAHSSDFLLSPREMSELENLNEDYRFHPESLNCPGF